MIEKVRQFVIENGMLTGSERVVVGVSGGVDSVVLLDALRHLKDLTAGIYVAHLDHGLRPESAHDAAFVRNLAERLDLPFYCDLVDVNALAASEARGIEETARNARYAFLHRTARTVGAERIAVGHQADDQAETVLLHLLRGTGLNGLGGMSPMRRDGLIRPLLGISRQRIMEYARQHSLAWIDDESNVSVDFRRNRIRRDLLTLLEREYNPNIRAALFRLAEVSRAAEHYIVGEAERVLAAGRELSGGGFVIPVDVLRNLPPALGREALRLAVHRAAPGMTWPSFERVEALRQSLERAAGCRILQMGRGVEARHADGFITFSTGGSPSCPGSRRPLVLPCPGWVDAHEFGLLIQCELSPWHGSTERLKAMPKSMVCLDLDRLTGEPVLRDWCEGETFQPLGRNTAVRVSDFLAKQGVPGPRRKSVPVVSDNSGIVWVVGFRPGDTARITHETRRMLTIRVCPEES